MMGLRADLEDALGRFTSERWRDRKQATRDLLGAVKERPPAPHELAALIERLLDGLASPDSVAMRSACHEALVGIGAACGTAIRRRLRAGGPSVRMVVDLLADLGSQDDVPLLVGLLVARGDDNVRASAAAALGALGGAEAARALEAALADEAEMLRLFALDALARIGARVAPERLAPLLADPVTRRAATAVLGYSEDPAAAGPLVALLVDSMAGVRAAAAVATVRLQRTLALAGGSLAATAALTAADAELLRGRLRELIGHRQGEVKLAALALCEALGDAGALPHVLFAMSDPDLRERAIEFAAGLGVRAVPVLAELVERAPPEARGDLFVLIGAVGPSAGHPRLCQALIDALGESDAHAACMAAAALGRVGGASALEPLALALALEGPAGEAAAGSFAEVALRAVGPRLAQVTPYMSFGERPSGALARNACRVLGLLGRAGDVAFVPPLIARLGDRDVAVRLIAARALGQIAGDHEGVAALCLSLSDVDPGVRAAACRSLGQLGAGAAADALLAASRDPSAGVRAAAVRALVELDNPVALPRLREVVLSDPAPAVVIQAIAGLGRSGVEQDVAVLMNLCLVADHEVVKAAIRGLGRCREHRATAAVLGLLSHDRWDVRWAAAEALAERGDATALGPLRRVHAVEPDPLVRQVLAGAAQRLVERAGEGEAGASG